MQLRNALRFMPETVGSKAVKKLSMDIVRRQADDFYTLKYEMARNINEFVDNLTSELYRYNRTSDKIAFIEQILEKIKKDRDNHLINCLNRETCQELKEMETAIFFAEQELEANGIRHDNIFDSSEIYIINSKLDELITELKTLKNDVEKIQTGQQITYDDFIEEFETLKKQSFLDKKTWRQVFFGKLYEMTLSGVISQTLSVKIMELFGDIFPGDTIKRLTQ